MATLNISGDPHCTRFFKLPQRLAADNPPCTPVAFVRVRYKPVGGGNQDDDSWAGALATDYLPVAQKEVTISLSGGKPDQVWAITKQEYAADKKPLTPVDTNGDPLPGNRHGEVVMTPPKRSMPTNELLSDQGAGLGNLSMTFDPSTPRAPYYKMFCKDATMAWNSSPTPMAIRENKGADKRGGARALNPPKIYEVSAPASANPVVVIPASDFAANGPVECTALPEDIRGGKADGTDNLGYPLVDADGHLESNAYASIYLGTLPKPSPAVNKATWLGPILYLLQ
jgi:hypothetical protein